MDYIRNPQKIEGRSMEIIREALVRQWKYEELPVVERIIHTTGDFQYEDIISIHGRFMESARKALSHKTVIYCDTRMIMAGVNRGALEKAGITLVNYLDHEDVVRRSRETGETRSALGMEKAVEEGIRVFAIGNAPTALFRLLEMVDRGFTPDLVIGVPVGFVGAKESKEHLSTYDIPHITTLSTKGGSNVAVSIINALLYSINGR